MSGTPAHDYDVTIIGAGISGLSLAYYLEKCAPHLSVALLESTDRAGGVIATHHEQGCILDQGPDSFITAKPHAEALCKEIGLGPDLIPFGKGARPLWMVKDGHLAKLPDGLYLGLPKKTWEFLANPTLPMTLKMRMGLDLLHQKTERSEDISLGDFLRAHFGQKSIDWIFNPILGGIYASHVDTLSTQATFPQFLALERKHGSLIRGLRAQPLTPKDTPARSPFLSLRQGMGQLIKTLQLKLSTTKIFFNHPVTRMDFNASTNTYTLTVDSQKRSLTTRQIILALPPARARDIAKNLPQISACFDSFVASSTAVVFLAFETKSLPTNFQGLGFLVPRQENLKTLAGTFVSRKFDGRSPDDIFLLRTFFGGFTREDILSLNDTALSDLALTEAQQILGIKANPLFTKVFRYHQQSPLYRVGHLNDVAEFEKKIKAQPGFHYLSNALYGVGIPDCIRKAKELAEHLSKK